MEKKPDSGFSVPDPGSVRRTAFLTATRWADNICHPLPRDASQRRYFRLTRGTQSCLLMEAPPEHENLAAFIKIADHLRSLGLRSPTIEHADLVQGLALIEDFGDANFGTLIDAGFPSEPLYAVAVDVLAYLHQNPQAIKIDLPLFDTDKLLVEVDLFPTYYLSMQSGQPASNQQCDSFREAWAEALLYLPKMPPTLVLRDYFPNNLIRIGNQYRLENCGILDFQDAVIGHPAYDLISLIEDARRDVSPMQASAMRHRYRQLCSDTMIDLEPAYALLGAQRHARVAGVFVRLAVRDHKPHYLKHLPRVMRLLAQALRHPVLAPVQAWFSTYLPDLKSKY